MPGAPKELKYLIDQMIDRWVEIYEDYDLYWIPDNGIEADNLYRPEPTHNSNPYMIIKVIGYNKWAIQKIIDEFSEFFEYYKNPFNKASNILTGQDNSLSEDSLYKIRKLKEKIVSVRTERLTWIKDWAIKHINNLDECHKADQYDIDTNDKMMAHLEKDYKKTFIPKLEFKTIKALYGSNLSVFNKDEWDDGSITIDRYGNEISDEWDPSNGFSDPSAFYEIIQMTKHQDVYVNEQEQQETVDLLEIQNEADSWGNDIDDPSEGVPVVSTSENGNVAITIDSDSLFKKFWRAG